MSIFETGRDYTFHILEDASGELGSGSSVWRVDEVDGTLLKLYNQYAGSLVLNTASLYFVKAEPV